MRLIVDNHIGDIASVIGVLVSLIGFVWTLHKVRRVRRDFRKVDLITEFSAAIEVMEEIKRLHRQKAWPILPDRYSALKARLVSIRAWDVNLSDSDKTVIQDAVTTLTGLQGRIEKAAAGQAQDVDIVRMNAIVNRHIDSLRNVLVRAKDKIGR